MGQTDVRILYAVLIIFAIKTALGQQTWRDDLKYEDLESLGASCEPRYTCVNATYELDETAERDSEDQYDDYCDCGIKCIKYDTCCVDSPYRRYNTKFYRGSEVQGCVRVLHWAQSFFMVNECNPMWGGQAEIENKCSNTDDDRDFYSLVPAYNHENDTTYKNIFCAICNGVEPESLTLWTMKMHAVSFRNYSEEELLESVIFNEEKGYWGRWENFEGTWVFLSISIFIEIPKWSHLKHCNPNIIQNCNPTWTDQSVSQKCRSYLAPIYVTLNDSRSKKGYRNVHCAICNYVTTDQKFSCYGEGYTDLDEFRPNPSFSGGLPIAFTLLLDVNPKDGAQVGTTNKCKSGELYDPFFKKCRSVVCGLPDHVINDNKCSKA